MSAWGLVPGQEISIQLYYENEIIDITFNTNDHASYLWLSDPRNRDSLRGLNPPVSVYALNGYLKNTELVTGEGNWGASQLSLCSCAAIFFF